ncbi:MAG: hypothetical protein PUH61_01160 [Bacteroidales bacterium]|nr:hypothetical protein [Bacteroidales bacterium]MDY2710128.1 hypothetical protein [Sodaliphilus sp.]
MKYFYFSLQSYAKKSIIIKPAFENGTQIGTFWAQWKNTGGQKQKHKKQPFGDASASHLSLVLWHV